MIVGIQITGKISATRIYLRMLRRNTLSSRNYESYNEKNTDEGNISGEMHSLSHPSDSYILVGLNILNLAFWGECSDVCIICATYNNFPIFF